MENRGPIGGGDYPIQPAELLNRPVRALQRLGEGGGGLAPRGGGGGGEHQSSMAMVFLFSTGLTLALGRLIAKVPLVYLAWMSS